MSRPKRHPFVSMHVTPEELQLAQLRLWELGATGLEERDQTTLAPGSDDELVTLVASFGSEALAQRATRLILGALDQRIRGGERLLDVGCGSGVLSIAALRLGAASAVGVDIDEDAVTVARRNAKLNGVDAGFEGSTTPLAGVDGLYDVVLANIETRVLVHISDAVP